jgi:hypothetical protein
MTKSSEKTLTQCRLVQLKEDESKAYHTAWIDTKYAVRGNLIWIEGKGGDWIVEQVFTTLPEEEVADIRYQWKHHKKQSEI